MISSEPKSPEPDAHVTKTHIDPSIPAEESRQSEAPAEGKDPVAGEEGEEEEEEEEQGECGFCLFMKGGGCKDTFTAWEECIKEAEKKEENMVEKCFEVTRALKLCMEAHSDYYEPLLRAEKEAEEQYEREKAAEEKGEGQRTAGDSKVSESKEAK